MHYRQRCMYFPNKYGLETIDPTRHADGTKRSPDDLKYKRLGDIIEENSRQKNNFLEGKNTEIKHENGELEKYLSEKDYHFMRGFLTQLSFLERASIHFGISITSRAKISEKVYNELKEEFSDSDMPTLYDPFFDIYAYPGRQKLSSIILFLNW